jgi:NAD(P)-dependent dehydrogenase (short-subunit alcohol dehydrogenase family)
MNNAAEKHTPTSRAAVVTDITPGEWDRVVAVNLTGTVHCVQAVVPDMRAAGWGRIVTISSAGAQSGAPNRAHYAAAKGGVISLTKALAFELGPDGITANTIPPGIIDTPMARASEKEGDLDVEAAGTRMPLLLRVRDGPGQDPIRARPDIPSERPAQDRGRVLRRPSDIRRRTSDRRA